jgi:hypothetical protein
MPALLVLKILHFLFFKGTIIAASTNYTAKYIHQNWDNNYADLLWQFLHNTILFILFFSLSPFFIKKIFAEHVQQKGAGRQGS